MTKRLDQKLARIRAGKYKPTDFIIADAKDGDMGPSLTSCGPKREKDGSWKRYRTRTEFLDEIRALVRQNVLDIMLVSASNLELLNKDKLFAKSAVQPAIRANDTTCIWRMRGATYHDAPSRPFRSAALPRVMYGTAKAPAKKGAIKGADFGLYSMTFNNDIEADIRSLEAFADFRAEASALGFRYFLEVFNPNVDTRIDPKVLPHYINDSILRCLAGVTLAERPLFLKIAYNGPKALEELASFDPSLVVGVLGGGAGTTRDAFELIHQAEKYGARVALFGRKINLAESQLEMVAMLRRVASGEIAPKEAVKAYHGQLKKLGIAPARSLEDDSAVTETVLREAAA
ncbi:MAG TPA: hypothetical protein VMW18_21055 [Candidatus Binatia bacterium]|nr:hypothetical protein [Candidatus Binatia bacterium]